MRGGARDLSMLRRVSPRKGYFACNRHYRKEMDTLGEGCSMAKVNALRQERAQDLNGARVANWIDGERAPFTKAGPCRAWEQSCVLFLVR